MWSSVTKAQHDFKLLILNNTSIWTKENFPAGRKDRINSVSEKKINWPSTNEWTKKLLFDKLHMDLLHR